MIDSKLLLILVNRHMASDMPRLLTARDLKKCLQRWTNFDGLTKVN